MAFETRREILFVYSVRDANPNGDPLNANHPRMDEDSGQILASDVRVKRTVRDEWLRRGEAVFVDGETKTLANRVKELKEQFGVDSGKEILARCIDTRLFGSTFALGKESFSWTGPVQFKWARSFHRAKVEMIQGTAAFATKDESGQRSFRNEYLVPFCLLGVYGIANQYASATTGASAEDLDSLVRALWGGTNNLITRSKVGHASRLLLELEWKEEFCGSLGFMDEKVALRSPENLPLSEEDQYRLRRMEDCLLSLDGLLPALEAKGEFLKGLRVFWDGELPLICRDVRNEKALKVLEEVSGASLSLESE